MIFLKRLNGILFIRLSCSHSVATSMKNVAPIRSQLPFLSYNGTPLRPRKDE